MRCADLIIVVFVTCSLRHEIKLLLVARGSQFRRRRVLSEGRKRLLVSDFHFFFCYDSVVIEWSFLVHMLKLLRVFLIGHVGLFEFRSLESVFRHFKLIC